MRPKLKTGDSILVNKSKFKSTAHWGIYLKYDAGVIHYKTNNGVFYCTFKDIIEAVSSTGEKLK
jgi:putative cofactor-binding repeat protein